MQNFFWITEPKGMLILSKSTEIKAFKNRKLRDLKVQVTMGDTGFEPVTSSV